jgi:hypothetical protein
LFPFCPLRDPPTFFSGAGSALLQELLSVLNMATSDFFFPSKYGNFCAFLPKQPFARFAGDFFLPPWCKISPKKIAFYYFYLMGFFLSLYVKFFNFWKVYLSIK